MAAEVCDPLRASSCQAELRDYGSVLLVEDFARSEGFVCLLEGDICVYTYVLQICVKAHVSLLN